SSGRRSWRPRRGRTRRSRGAWRKTARRWANRLRRLRPPRTCGASRRTPTPRNRPGRGSACPTPPRGVAWPGPPRPRLPPPPAGGPAGAVLPAVAPRAGGQQLAGDLLALAAGLPEPVPARVRDLLYPGSSEQERALDELLVGVGVGGTIPAESWPDVWTRAE